MGHLLLLLLLPQLGLSTHERAFQELGPRLGEGTIAQSGQGLTLPQSRYLFKPDDNDVSAGHLVSIERRTSENQLLIGDFDGRIFRIDDTTASQSLTSSMIRDQTSSNREIHGLAWENLAQSSLLFVDGCCRISAISMGSSTVTEGTIGSTVNGLIDGAGANARFDDIRDIAVDLGSTPQVGYIAAKGVLRMVDITTKNVTTLAGNGVVTQGQTSKVDGSGAVARLLFPSAIEVDNNYIYWAEGNEEGGEFKSQGGIIRRIHRTYHNVTTIAGGFDVGSVDGTGTIARFNQIGGLARIDNTLYISDSRGSKIRQMNLQSFEVTSFFGSGSADRVDGIGTNAGITAPMALVIDAASKTLWATEGRDSRTFSAIRKLTETTSSPTTSSPTAPTGSPVTSTPVASTPTATPTMNPTASLPNDGSSDSGSVCFLGTEKIKLESGDFKEIRDVVVGDRVEVAKWINDTHADSADFATVIFIPHVHQLPKMVLKMVEIRTNKGIKLTVTPDHLLPSASTISSKLSFRSAAQLTSGMYVSVVEGKERGSRDQILTVKYISLSDNSNVNPGVQTLITEHPDGLLVVNGVVASSFGHIHWIPNLWYKIHRAAIHFGIPLWILNSKPIVTVNELIGDISVAFKKYFL